MAQRLSKPFLRSGELASLAGVSTDTLRHYERVGVLPVPHRHPNGYRAYPPAALDRVRLVRRALSAGFTLRDLGRLLQLRERGGVPCRDVRNLARAKLLETQEQLRELTRLQAELRRLLKNWDQRLARAGPGRKAHLLESLAAGESEAGRRPERRGKLPRRRPRRGSK